MAKVSHHQSPRCPSPAARKNTGENPELRPGVVCSKKVAAPGARQSALYLRDKLGLSSVASISSGGVLELVDALQFSKLP